MIKAISLSFYFVAAIAFSASGEDLARWVDPFVGTKGTGNCFPGVCRPFGMAQPSPDTGDKVYSSGYKFSDTTIRAFSQTHLNGTGRPAMGDISVMPFVGNAKNEKGSRSFDKASEVAEIGYYAVTLEGGVKCEATATERVAVWRFTWPAGSERQMLVDAAAMLMQGFNAKYGASVLDASSRLTPDCRTIYGGKTARGWTLYKLFYAIEFSEPWAKIEKLPSDPFQGKGDRWSVSFDLEPKKCNACLPSCAENSLEVRIALSTVSEEGAAKNLKAEAQSKTFDDVRAECRAEWNALLSRAKLVKGTDEQKKNWYTSLYHLFIQPNIQTDVDGKYRGADDAIHVALRGHYSTFSLWDTFRAAHPLYTILVPERVPGFIDSLVDFGEQHTHLPTWTMWNEEVHCMVGIHSIPVIVDAWKKGLASRSDAMELLTLMVQSMINNDGENPKNCWNAYWENGYIPYTPGEFDLHVPQGQSVSTTLELAYDWWCIADFARIIGDSASAAKAQKWAECWRNVFDKEIGFVRARAPQTAGGKWREPFDPANPRAGGLFWSDFTEANSWIYSWHVFQDTDALAEAFGGREKALSKLDAFFSGTPYETKVRSANNDEGGFADDPGQIGYYWHGNEPSHHIAYLYSLWGQRGKTASLVERLCRKAYRPVPDGLCGNDDCGQMSAWYLFSMMGFYPVNPCGDGYVLGEVQADEIRISVNNGKSFSILKRKDSNDSDVCLNGQKIDRVKISHEEIVRGGTLEFVVSD